MTKTQAERTTLEGMSEFFEEAETVQVSEVIAEELDHPDRLLPQLAEPSIDQILHSLTVEFSYRLCEERQRILNLEQQLAEKDELLKRLPDLQKALTGERSNLSNKDTEMNALRSRISNLENQLQWWQKPWWSRWFSADAKPA